MTVHTVLGAAGSIGRQLTQYLLRKGEKVNPIRRNDPIDWQDDLGHVYYCIGMTADFRTDLYATATAHTHVLQEFLEKARFQSFLYMSSTRVYQGAANTSESGEMAVNPNRHEDFYNISKLMGESLSLTQSNPSVRVVRISNVINPAVDLQHAQNFFDSVLHDALLYKQVELHSSLKSEKDYIDIEDVVRLVFEIATKGEERIYNIARGENISVANLLQLMKQFLDFAVRVAPNAPSVMFSKIDISRLQNEFTFAPRPIAESIENCMKTAILRGVHENSN